MAYIHCVTGGSSGPLEVITGTMTGASGATSAGQVTITSQQGKAPKLAEFWNDSNSASNTNGLSWNDTYPTTSRVWYGAGTTSSRAVGAGSNATYPTVMSVGADSISFQCCTNATYYTGTWEYVVEFE